VSILIRMGVRKTRRLEHTGRRRTRRNQSGRKVPKRIPMPGPNQCHPHIGSAGGALKGGCFPTDVLNKAAKSLGLPTMGGGEKEKETLVKQLANHLGVKETDQRSLLKSLPLPEAEKEELSRKWLRPEMPASWKEDPDMWLDSNNIRDVMKQYEEARPDFKFLGPYPIDFAAPDPYEKGSEENGKCLIGEMCSLNLDKEQLKGKNHIGIIYNLDPHDKGGSHWVANYINVPRNECYYFDSYGMKPPKQINKFMQWLGIQEPNIKLGWNGRRFQKMNTECGMYCMYFLDRMLAGEPYLKFCRRAPPDRFMLDLRDWMFST
jgi:hypothetical protein